MGKNNNDFIKVCAYLALALSAVVFLVNALLGFFGGNLGLLGSILLAVGQIAMAISVAMPAYQFTKGKGAFVVILYWVALILYVASAVLPIFQGIVA